MNFLYQLYFILPSFSNIGIFGKIIRRIIGMIFKRIFDAFVPAFLKRTANKAGHGLNTEHREETYIVSLTSFPARIDEIWITIETIMRQSFKPDKILLWLATSQFPEKRVPNNLMVLQKRGLTIVFCEEDLRSHKKYFYSFQHYPNANIITVDDDVYYPKDFLLHLFNLHIKNPKSICANRTHKIEFSDGSIKPYRKWKHNFKEIETPSHLLVQVGVGGVLYPPGSIHSEVFNRNLLTEICFHADDLWLKVMAFKNNTFVVTNKKYNKEFLTIKSSQKQKLVSNNVFGGGNDEQLKNVLSHYKIDLHK